MKNHSRLGIAVASLTAASLALTACSGGSPSTSEEAPESITWMTILHTPTTPEKNGPVESALEEYTGVDIDIQWVPDASKDEKINAAIASDSLADVTTLTNIANTSVRQALASGQFWDVEPYLDEFPNLSEIPDQTIDSARVDGGLYGVPLQKPMARYGVIVRQDWLDNLGLDVPHTIEELAEVAIAFTENDPDGNGIDDTTGFIDRAESSTLGFRMLSGYFGAGNIFEADGDEIIPSFTTDAYKQAMEWYRGLYEKGAINGEFVTMQKQNQIDAIAQGKGGIVVTGLFEAKNYMNLARSGNPETPMAWALINDMTFEDVPRRINSDTNGGFGGWLAISTSRVKSEGELKAVLGFLDKMLDEEPYTLMTYGIEGTHYTLEDGVVSVTDQTMWEQQVQPYSSSRVSDIVVQFKDDTPYVNEANEKMAENAEYAVVNVALPLSSETYDRSWTTIQQAATDAYNKYMVGQLDMAGYEAAIEQLRGQGLDAIVEELSAAYAESR